MENKSKFHELYRLIIEDLSQIEINHIKSSVNNFIDQLEQNEQISKSLAISDGEQTVKSDLSNSIYRQTKRTLNFALEDKISDYLTSRNIPEQLFIDNFSHKFIDDIQIFFQKISNQQMLTIQQCDGKSVVSEIANFYGISESFVTAVMNFTYRETGIVVGPGQLGLSFFLKDSALSSGKGDVVIGEELYEVKSDGGRIPDLMPLCSVCRAAALSVINSYLQRYRNTLVHKQLLEPFNDVKWLVLYDKGKYNSVTKKLFETQFEVVEGVVDIDKRTILKDILNSVFGVYGESADYILQNIDKVVGDNFDLNVERLIEVTVQSFVSYYRGKMHFSKLVFLKKGKWTLRIIDPEDYNTIIPLVKLPVYTETSNIYNHTTLTVK